MYKIGEFSKITMLTVKALRYYDEIGLLVPAAVDPESGYRLYDQANYDRAIMIQLFKRFDFSIQELLEVIPSIADQDDIAAFLLEKHQLLSQQMTHLAKKQDALIREVGRFKEGYMNHMTETIHIKEIGELTIASLRYKGRYDQMGEYIGQLFKAVGGQAAGAPFAMYYDGDFKEDDADIEVAVPVKKAVNSGSVTTRRLPACRTVTLVHIGSYSTLGHSYKVLADYIASENLNTIVPSREHYIKGPGMLLKGNENKYRTEIQVLLIDENTPHLV